MLSVLSVLESYSKSGPNIDEVLFKEDLSLAVSRLEPKMASKSTLDALSSRATSGPKVRLELRCLYNFKI